MEIDDLLVAALEAIPVLQSRVIPLVDVRSQGGPLVVYTRSHASQEQSLEGCTGLYRAEYTVYVLHQTYRRMLPLATAVNTQLQSLQGVRADGLWIEQAVWEQISPDAQDISVNLVRRTLRVTLDYQIIGG